MAFSTSNVTEISQNEQSPMVPDSSEDTSIKSWAVYLVPIFFSLIFLLGIMGNAVVIAVMVRSCNSSSPQAGNTTNRFLLNLAIADLLFLIFCVPFQATIYSMRSWPFGGAACVLTEFFQKFSMVASVYTLVALSLDRYCAVAFATSSKQHRTKKNSSICLGIIWSLALLFGTLAAFTRRHFTFNGIQMCILNYNYPHLYIATIILNFVFGYVLPLVLIFVCYAGLVWSMTKSARKSIINKKRTGPDPTKKITTIVIVVVIVFAVDWLLYHVLNFWIEFGDFPFTSFTLTLKIIGHCLSYANSCINPIVYAFISKKFRKEFRIAITSCNWKKKNRPVGTTTRRVFSKRKKLRECPDKRLADKRAENENLTRKQATAKKYLVRESGKANSMKNMSNQLGLPDMKESLSTSQSRHRNAKSSPGNFVSPLQESCFIAENGVVSEKFAKESGPDVWDGDGHQTSSGSKEESVLIECVAGENFKRDTKDLSTNSSTLSTQNSNINISIDDKCLL